MKCVAYAFFLKSSYDLICPVLIFSGYPIFISWVPVGVKEGLWVFIYVLPISIFVMTRPVAQAVWYVRQSTLSVENNYIHFFVFKT